LSPPAEPAVSIRPIQQSKAAAAPVWRSAMLRWSILFLIAALIAGLFGFFEVAGTTYTIAKVLFVVFLVLFVVSLLMGTQSTRDIV
jgi:uncharacterized membrane protein YtjA (UPF0391 family)